MQTYILVDFLLNMVEEFPLLTQGAAGSAFEILEPNEQHKKMLAEELFRKSSDEDQRLAEGAGKAGEDEQKDTPALSEVNLTIPAGEVVALVGPSGAGKTTLAGLLSRFHDPSAGSVLLDGVDLRGIPLTDLRHAVALVPQKPFLFDATVRENVEMGKSPYTEATVEEERRAVNEVAERERQMLAHIAAMQAQLQQLGGMLHERFELEDCLIEVLHNAHKDLLSAV